ncbi:MAG: YbaK/EbsC family protein [Actinomycetota bacterium]|nr:YbaK/EbsC family protein [Actinomycetota bacterium]
MSKRPPVTAAVRVLRKANAEYTEYVYEYGRFPGALGAAEYIGIDPHLTAKTIIFASSDGDGVVVLMHGDQEVSTKALARVLGVKSTVPASQDQGRRWTGYEFGGTSPLGLRTNLPVFAQKTLASLETIYVNAGKQGFVIGIDSRTLLSLSAARLVDVSA